MQFKSAPFIVLTLLLGASPLFGANPEIAYPELKDDRLQISLYADDPDIVTPIGGVCDSAGKLYVIESHTHNPPKDYLGPKGDRIKVFEGIQPNGRFERMSVFADDIFQAQALAFDPNGTLYVVCTREVLVLHDRDGDGRSEARTRILHLDPYEKRGNPHGQMQGIAFSNDGWLYLATGTTSDDWISADGQHLRVGPYWGGIIARCRPDGSKLERIAWGFWNPYSLTFDRFGRLLAIDNDPDHRGPNRLLHIIPGGDYGYKRQYGRYGLHPYQAWQGELPGTLPMMAGIGEAPTAVIEANAAALPNDYQDTVLGASWGEHNLTLYRTTPAGASLQAEHEILLQGLGHDDQSSPFRPSGLAASPVDGAIYVSDWMLIDYTTHRRGRIWRISAKPDVPTISPRKPYSRQTPTGESQRLNKLLASDNPIDYPALREATKSEDSFIRSAAVTAMAKVEFRSRTIEDLEHEDAPVRLGALLALRRADVAQAASYIEPRLSDPDLEVVQTAMLWAGEKEFRQLTSLIDATTSRPGLTEAFFRIWLATMEILQPESVSNAAANSSGKARYNRKLNPEFISQLASDPSRPPLLRAMAIRWIADLESSAHHELLTQLANSSESRLRIEAIRRLGDSLHPDTKNVVRAIAHDRATSEKIRTEAIAALAGQPDSTLIPLLDDAASSVQLEAARSLRTIATDPDVSAAVEKKLATIHSNRNEARLISQLEFLTSPAEITRPRTAKAWKNLLAEGGDVDAGRRVFFSANSACVACHSAEGRGGRLGSGSTAGFVTMPFGPDLSLIARTASREAIIHSIVRPSDSIAPEYHGWFVDMKDGERHTGREIDQERNAVQLIMLDGHERNFPHKNIESWGAMALSLMPEGIPETMAIEEFRDLIAYLCSLK